MHDRSTPRPLTHQERGHLGAVKRWADHPGPIRINDLTVDQRRVVLALIAAQRAANEKAAAVIAEPEAAGVER